MNPPVRPTPPITRVVALVLFELGAVAVIHRLGGREFLQVDWSNIGEWLDSTPVEDVGAAVTRLVALGIAYWLLFSTLAYVLVSLSRRSSAIRATGWMTLPPIRRIVSQSVALSVAASSIVVPLGPAVADLALGSGGVVVEVDPDGVRPVDPPPTVEPGEDPATDVLLPPHLRPSADPSSEEQPADRDESRSGGNVDASSSEVHKVERGDHLWSIACQHLKAVLAREELSEHEIAPYWVRVIEANRSTIRSGDPDLIYPGEQIVLPLVES